MSFEYSYSGFGGSGGIDLTLLPNKTFDEIAKNALETVRPDVESATKEALRGSIQHSGASELVSSVKCFEPRMTRNKEGAVISCQPTGSASSGNRYNNQGRSHKVHNNDKAFWLEYGNAHQDARPWKDRAVNKAESRSMSKLEDAIAKELGAE